MNPSSTTSSAKAFERFCREYVGLALEPFQRKIVRELYAPRRELLVMIPRGNGKTTLFSALALFHLVGSREPAVYVAAASRDQARLTFETARKMASRHPALERRVTSRWNELRVKDGFLRVLSSDAPRAHGLAPTLALVDELHAHASDDLYVALKTALGKREGAQLATISTAGYDASSTLGKLREKALSLPEVKRRGTLTTAREKAAGFAMLEWACREDDDLSDPKVVKRANPATFVDESFLAEQIASPGLHPLEFARYHANVWTDTATSWLPPGAWQACAGDAEIEPGERVWMGVDIGGERAASAIVWVTEDLRVGCEVFQGDSAVLEVRDRVRELAEVYMIAELAFDPWRFQQAALELQAEGMSVIAFPQTNSRMVPASERLYGAVKEGRITHPNLPELNRHVATAVARKTARGWRLDKERSREQIDAVVALAMALERCEDQPAPAEVVGWI
ncbi:MAG: terminase large subunit domain-containing protein [Solirubrobacterales bacterium]